MSTNSLISIIIPVYNAKDYIEKCLESLVNQTYTNIEIICVDDCSTDNSSSLIKNYIQKDGRIKLFKTLQNSGPATARNIGLDNANGEYIMFCDNDDSYTQNMCEIMVNAIKEYNVDIVTCKANIENRELNKELANYINCNLKGYIKLKPNIKHTINVLLWNKIYKKSIIDKYNIRFPDGVAAEDDAFNITYAAVIDTYYGLDNYLYNHVFQKKSFTNTIGCGKNKSKRFDKIKIIKFIYDFFVTNNILIKEQEHFDNKVTAELVYMFIYNPKLSDKIKIIKLYNDFVKQAHFLDYKKYNYYNFYLKLNKRINLKYIVKLINQYFWF